MKFLVDNQLPAAPAEFLRKRNLDCQHVLEVGLAQASDSDIRRYATEQGRIIVTKDEDFLYLASQPNSQVKLIWVGSAIAAPKRCLPPSKASGRNWKPASKRVTGSSNCADRFLLRFLGPFGTTTELS